MQKKNEKNHKKTIFCIDFYKHFNNIFSPQSHETDFRFKAKIRLKLFCMDLQASEQYF